MSINPLNDISRVYLDQVAVDEAKVDKLKPEHERATARDARSEFSNLPGSGARRARRAAHRERDELNKDVKDIRRGRLSGPQFQGETGRERIELVRKLKKIKEAAKPDYLDFDKDGNKTEPMKKALKDKQKVEEAKKANDGNLANNYPPYDKVTRGDVIAGRLGKDEMGGKKKITKEGYSNWRQDLAEVMTDTKADQKITEKKVDNKIKTSAIGGGIKLGEAIENLGGTLLEMVEIDEAKVESGESEATKKDIRSRRYVQKTKGDEGVRNYDAMGPTAPNWVTAARRRAHAASRGVRQEEIELSEKAESEQQQKLFGLALSVKRGDTPRSEVSDAVLKIVDTMSEKKIRDFAKTKHEGIPKKVSEQAMELQPKTKTVDQQTKKTQQQQDRMRQQEVQILQRKLQALRSAPKGTDPSITAGYEPEGEIIDENEALKLVRASVGPGLMTGKTKKPNPTEAEKAEAEKMSLSHAKKTSQYLHSSPRD